MNLKHHDIILRPIVTERTMDQRAMGKYTFQVHSDANKIQVRKAIEYLFKVHVAKVNTIKVPGKRRRFGRAIGRTPDWKKVIVTLKPGDKITVFGWQARDGGNWAHSREITLPDGKKLFFGPPAGTGDGGNTPAVEAP